MVMCSKCHKRVAVVFVAKVENGNKVSEGLCMKCAKELGIPVESMLGNVMDKMGIPAEMLQDMEGMEGDINEYLQENGLIPSDGDDGEEGGAPAIPMPKFIENSAEGTHPDAG